MDYSAFGLPPAPRPQDALSALGWRPFFSGQLGEDELALHPARVMGVHRRTLDLAHAAGTSSLPPLSQDDPAAVGDWVLLDPDHTRVVRRLDRQSVLHRRAPGRENAGQLIAANVDTLFIVTSCNEDFNLARLERYLALAYEAGSTPVVLLTKADLVGDPENWADRARGAGRGLLVETLDAKSPDTARRLSAWVRRGQTVAMVGSSGVGKSTLANTLLGGGEIATQAIREDDAKGRHTTTARALHPLPSGALLMDTPGMRELGLWDAASGIATVFADIDDLAARCRFTDCAHETEPGCAVTGAVSEGTLDPDRLARWRKLVDEEALNSRTTAERRRAERGFGRLVKEAKRMKPRRPSE